MVAVPSEELGTVLWIFVILIISNFEIVLYVQKDQ